MKVPALLLAALVALTLLSACPRPPAPENPNNQSSDAQAEPEPEPVVEAFALPDAAHIPIMIGLFAFSDDFRIDDKLRLEIPSGSNLGALIAHVATTEGAILMPDGTLKVWNLASDVVEQLFPTRVGMVIDCASPSLRFQGRLLSYELWQDTACSAAYLLAVIDTPQDEQINEPAVWIGIPHLPEVEILDLEESLQINEPPPAPPNIVGFYEKTDQLMQDIVIDSLASETDPAATDPAAQTQAGSDSSPTDTEAAPPPEETPIPVPIMDVRFGRFAAGQSAPSSMLLGSWMRDAFAARRALVIVDGEGTELWRVMPEALDRFALMGLQVEFLADINRDNIDELIITGNTPGGATQTMLWSLAGEKLTVLGETTWWGCESRIPLLIDEPHDINTDPGVQPPLEFDE